MQKRVSFPETEHRLSPPGRWGRNWGLPWWERGPSQMHDQTRLKSLTSGPAGLATLWEQDAYRFLLLCKLPPLVHLCRNWRASRANFLSICGKKLALWRSQYFGCTIWMSLIVLHSIKTPSPWIFFFLFSPLTVYFLYLPTDPNSSERSRHKWEESRNSLK